MIGDEVQLSGAQELATYLGKAESLQKLMPVMNDMLAQQYGLNASQEQATQVAAMMGKNLDDLEEIGKENVRDISKNPIEISARGLSHTGTVKPFDLDIRKGEVIGVTGLLGSGRSELARAIYGADKESTGTLKVDGKEVKISQPMMKASTV